MIRLIRVELLKLRTTRLSYGLLATAAGLTALFAVIEAARAGAGNGIGPLSSASGFNAVISAGMWALVLAAVMGVTVSSGEFRHSTATLTYLATPHRGRVLTAKAVAGAWAGGVFGLVGYVIALGVGLAFAAARGYHVAIWQTPRWPATGSATSWARPCWPPSELALVRSSGPSWPG